MTIRILSSGLTATSPLASRRATSILTGSQSRSAAPAFAAALLVLLSVAAAGAGANPSGRQRIVLDSDWRFRLADSARLRSAVRITDWRWREGDSVVDVAAITAPNLDTSGSEWQATRTGDDIFHGRVGFAWMRTSLPDLAKAGRTIHFDRVDDNCTVYLNGIRLVSHEGWDDPFDVALDSAWRTGGPNVLTLLVENTSGEGGVTRAARLGLLPPAPANDPTQPAFPDSRWRTVHLPHDYVVEGKFTPDADAGHGSLPVARAWYRRRFTLPLNDRGKSVWIDFDGVYRDARVYLNGKLLGEHPGGYTSFRFDISHSVRFGASNTVVVSVDPRHFEGWWYEGGGIYRHVWLNVADPAHVRPWGVFASARVMGGESAPRAAVVSVDTSVDLPAGRTGYVLTTGVISPSGQRVAITSLPLGPSPGGTPRLTQTIMVRSPVLWSLENPRLYTVVSEVRHGGRVVDRVTTSFGIRTIRFDADSGFFLNGKHVEIQGVCNHQDFAGVGIGVPDSLEYWRVAQLKKIGCNAWRTSHNPPTESLLDACDRLGMLVMDENRHLGDTFNAKTPRGTPFSDLSELDSMLFRDRNHPSIIMWSMCNEEPLQTSDEGARIFAAMRERTHELDPTRPVTCAMNTDSPTGIALVEDLRGFNYGPRVYPAYHSTFPTVRLYGSEIGSTTTTRGEYADDRAKGYVSAYDVYAPPWAQTAEDTWTPMAEHPFMAGGYVWTGFDYKGEPTPYGWPCVNSHFGLLDMCGFPKDDAFYYKTVWETKPQVHIFPHWNWPGRDGQPISVWAYSSADAVELYLNGRSLGRQRMPRYRHVEWSVPYRPGRLEARAYSSGAVVATDVVETTGAPAALRLTAERTRLTADGEDVAVVYVDVVDSKGRVVPDAANRIAFRVAGAGCIAGVGNGDPSDHDPDQAGYRVGYGYRKAFHGKCMVLVGAAMSAGAIRLLATSPGLKPGTLSVQSQ